MVLGVGQHVIIIFVVIFITISIHIIHVIHVFFSKDIDTVIILLA